jgi:DNA repair ATPase RecN
MRAAIARGDDRLREICRMLGDSGVRDASSSMARQMIDDAERDKSAREAKKTPAR